MGNFFAELKRRQMFRVAAAYAVVAWLLLQVFNNLTPVMRLPDWAGTLVLVLLVGGFPVALLFCWIQHLAPPEGSTAKPAKLDWLLLGALVLVIALVSYQQLAPPGAGTKQPARIALAPSAAQPGAISVAILPFVNLSSDKEQEFFSDGMTEEITSALAKVPNLRVVGRTSAFQFKNENQDLRAIGQALSASHLIEGSVRRDGNEVRITAQLIKADDGTHLWTESYNRELRGVFAIQEEIATAIASALRVPLGLREGQSLVANRTADTDSYQDYLRAKALVRTRGAPEPGGQLTEAAKFLEQVVARDPNYAPAWGLLGQTYVLIPGLATALLNGSTDELRPLAAETLQKAEAAGQEAIRLDPNNIDGQTALAYVRHFRGRFVEAENLYEQMLSRDPENPDVLHQYGQFLAAVGRLKESLEIRLRLQAQEPLVPIFSWNTAVVLWENGRNDEAVAILRAALPTVFTRLNLAQAQASMGRYGDAASALQEIPPGTFVRGEVEDAARLLRAAPANASPTQTTVSRTALSFVYLYAGAPNRALDYFEGLAEASVPVLGSVNRLLWAPAYAPVRKTQRFKDYVRKIGLIEYWRARGWPDLCRPVGADDFVCD